MLLLHLLHLLDSESYSVEERSTFLSQECLTHQKEKFMQQNETKGNKICKSRELQDSKNKKDNEAVVSKK